MAKKRKNTVSSPQITKEDITSFSKAVFALANSLQFRDLVNEKKPTYSDYTKEDYRTYIENPYNNESQLRNMSQFLSRVSAPYHRLLWYLSSIYSFYWNLTPKIDPLNMPDSDSLMQNYAETCKVVDNLDMSVEMTNALYFTLRDGAFYGFIYENDEATFIHRLNPDYCKPAQLEDGVFNFAFDFSYFDKYKEALDTWDPSFNTGYNAYKNDTRKMRWQILDPERTICIKAIPDLEINLPFFVGIFEALLDLIDARTLQRNKEVIQNYKLILQKIPFFTENGAKDLDDFKVDLDTVLKFSAQLADVVPEAVGVATTPMDIDTVDFKSDDNDNDLLSSSMKQVFDDSGVSQLLFNSNMTGSTGVDASIKVDTSLAWKFVQYIERWLKRYVKYHESGISYNVEILDVHIFNKDAAVDRELKLAQNGVPNKMKLAASAGMTPVEVMSNQIWENEFLKIHENWVPLQTSYTLSSNGVGTPGKIGGEDIDGSKDSTEKNKDSGEDDSNGVGGDPVETI